VSELPDAQDAATSVMIPTANAGRTPIHMRYHRDPREVTIAESIRSASTAGSP
jgi:hypothetical protein